MIGTKSMEIVDEIIKTEKYYEKLLKILMI